MTDYKLVPVEPTAEMAEAAQDAYMPFGDMNTAIMMAVLEAPNHIAEARRKIGRPQIREAFLRNGAKIEPGRDDLPDWVYESVFELLEMAAPAVQGEPVAAPQPTEQPECGCCGQTIKCDDDCDAVVLRRAEHHHEPAEPAICHKFNPGDHVRKTKGSQWKGRVVGTYSTSLTPEGYAVESDTEKGSVQIYPVGALELVGDKP